MVYLAYLPLGLLPSLIWLSFYLRKDNHPEPNRMIIKIFGFGILLAPLAIATELLLVWFTNPDQNPLNILAQTASAGLIQTIIAATLIPALVEEYLKYAVVKFKVLKNSQFDEPIDTMIYCLVAGLGFAAIENLLVLFRFSFFELNQAFGTIAFRFAGATLVHALASAMTGYWLAQALVCHQQRKRITKIGLALAIVFHACYNYLIFTAANQTGSSQVYYLLITALLLTSVALLVSFYFRQLKKQPSVCQATK